MQEIISKVKIVNGTGDNSEDGYLIVGFDSAQPVTVSNQPSSVEVSNLPSTQQVSGTVAVSNLPATQPVSGTVTVSNLPAIQQVAGTVAVSNPVTSVSVSNLPATQQVSGTVAVSNFPNPQPTRELMNTGRQQVCLSWENISGATAEAVTNFTNGSRGGVSLPAAASYTVSAGKTLRIQSVVFSFGQNGSSACNYRTRLRLGTTVSAPVLMAAGSGGPSNTANVVNFPVPDGLELAAGQSLCLSHVDTATGGVFSCCLVGFEY